MDLTTPELLSIVALLLIAGFAAGILAGLLGVGGGIIIVPIVYQVWLFAGIRPAMLMHIAVGTSLALIIPTAMRSAMAHHARGSVDPALLRLWALPLVGGVIAGVVLATRLQSAWLALIFAAVVLAMAGYLAFVPESFRLGGKPPGGLRGGLLAGVVGVVSALMGIGGGSLSVPAMTAYGVPVLRAVGTSSAFGVFIALPGAAGFMLTGWGQQGLPPLSLGYVNVLVLACLLPTTLLSVPLGVRLAHHFSAITLRRAFALFLLIMGVRMAYAGLAAVQPGA